MVTYTDSAKELVTRLAQIDASIKTLETKRRAIVDNLAAQGYAGCNVPSISGDIMVSLSSGYSNSLDEEKMKEGFADEYGSILSAKREEVKITYSDVKASKMLTASQLESVTEKVKATVKATIRRS